MNIFEYFKKKGIDTIDSSFYSKIAMWDSENSDMYRTIRKHEIILQDVLTDLIRTIIRLGKTANVSGLAENTDIVIDFDDSIIEDKQTERAEDRKDVAMGAMGLPEYRAKWYGETEEVAASKLPDQSAGVLM